jgi:TRAP-type C4-dicarboxylate transport system permease small subunit
VVCIVDTAIDRVIRLGAWLALPIAVLLFLQWPLREIVQRYSREANDLGQVCFALYVAIALTAASRRHAHLATDVIAHRFSPRARRRLDRAIGVLAVVPWTAFILWSGSGSALRSIRLLEGFPDTFNPGYFLIKVGVCLLALLLMLQTLLDLLVTDLHEP